MLKQTAMIIVFVGALASAATAQPTPDPSDELPPVRLAPVTIHTSATGDQVRGHLLDLSDRTLTILEAGQRRSLPLDTVLRIDVDGDSVRNGAIIGAAVLGGWCAIICGQGLSDGGQVVAASLANAGFGALLGAGIDALHQGRTTIFRRR